ncbi:MAG: hypothetical protein JWN27_2164, partial [Candidatus Eremiobacteraeota bacterium]|nr:hypothetical protein [Candidatus Eremiobacteraeota bacterium]
MRSGAGTLIDIVLERATRLGARPAFRFLGGDDARSELSYELLERLVAQSGAQLRRRFERGSLLLLALPTSPAAVVTVLGALRAGLLPALMPVPGHPRDTRSLQRLVQVRRRNPGAGLCVSPEGAVVLARAGGDAAEFARTALEIADAGEAGAESPEAEAFAGDPDGNAYVQYTSGSTQTPRGVVLTHRNLLANSELIARVFGHGDEERMLSWLPLHHDMGFIAHVVHSIAVGATSILASPAWFTEDPLRWLETIATERIGTSGAPPFAYETCLRCAEREPARLEGLDLSSWRNAYVGAEPVRWDLMQEFARRFAPYGLRNDAVLPCYGLAEASLFVAGGHARADEAAEHVRYPLDPAIDVEIRDPKTGAALDHGAEGEIVVAGASISREYYHDAEATAATRWVDASRTWLRTGDLGMLSDRALTITGRVKDVIIVRGANHHAADIEALARRADHRLRYEAVAAVAIPGKSTEGLAVVAEVKLGGGAPRAVEEAALREAIVDAVAAGSGIVPSRVLLVRRGTLPRTTSGKLARGAVRAALLDGCLDVAPGAPAATTTLRPAEVRSQSEREPIAIVGMACRFPGSDDPEAFWRHLAEGTDLIGEVPRERWDADAYFDARVAMPGKMNTRWGGFIEGADLFDAAFFGIAAHEAVEMDPQQRLLLEVAWRAFEHAGIGANALAGSSTGVFVGISTNDYLQLQIAQKGSIARFNAYSGLGSATSIAANRLSYAFDLRGPSFAVDTACSSSLTALHLAVQSLRNGECAQALAGGVSLILSPGTSVALSQFGMMAPDGRCKVFDQSADGYVRSEGCGLLVLKRLADARSNGDRVLAVVRGTALGQDGRTPGITAPNPDAQHRLLRDALADAATAPNDVTFVEAHGTGTPTGDPAEMQEVKRIYGFAPGLQCFVGSVKANAGHLEAAAGVASTIKMVQALRHRAIPPHLHLHELNDRIDLSGTRLQIPDRLAEWRTRGATRVGAVSSFGFGGALAHAIVSESPDMLPERAESDGPWLVPLSANDGDALVTYASDVRHALLHTEAPHAADIAYTLGVRRTHYPVRAFVVARDRAELARALPSVTGRDVAPAGGIAFLFSGQGSQWAGMGAGLYRRFPAFRSAFDRCADAFAAAAPHAPPLCDVAFDDDAVRLETAALLQPALFALEYALAALWRSFGVAPSAVIGHSLGEIVAATVAGCASLEDAMTLVTARAALMERVSERGAMAAVRESEEQIARKLAAWRLDRVEIAAVNGARSIVLAGPATAIDEALERLAAERVAAQRLRTPQAFHSPLMDPVLDDFERAAARATWHAPSIPLISNVTGTTLTVAPDAAYWRRHVRDAVRFAGGLDALAALGPTHAVEIGPGDTLAQLVRARDADGPVAISSLVRDRDDAQSVLEAAGELYRAGVVMDWKGIQADDADAAAQRRPAGELPGHPYRRQRYWFNVDDPPAVPAFATAAARASAQSAWVSDVAWDPVHRAIDGDAVLNDAERHWIVVGDGRGLGAALAARIAARSHPVFHLVAPPTGSAPRRRFEKTGGVTRVFVGDPASTDATFAALGEVLNRLAPAGAARWNVICVSALDAAPARGLDVATLDAGQRRYGPGALTALAQAIVRSALGIRVWIVTAGSQAVVETDTVEVGQATSWGFGTTLFLEHPEMRGGLIDIESHRSATAADDVFRAIAAGDGGDAFVATRADAAYVPLLRPAAARADAAPLALSPEGSYLVTGGLGGLGLATAQWLAARGARHVVLLGRTGLPPRDTWNADVPSDVREKIDGVQAVEALGARVEIVAADVADTARLRTLIAELDVAGRPLRGVVHAAGVNWFARVADVDGERLLGALRVKVAATWALHELTRDLPLDLFVLYSSVSALWGSVDLAHYTASNAFLDAVAAHRRALGLPALSIDWGPWASVGMSAKPREVALLQKLGLRLMPPDAALAALESALRSGAARAVIADIDWD